MAKRDLHQKGFDESTKTKLELFRLYFRSWIRVAFYQPHVDVVNIFDFFSGPGTDTDGNFGSPIIFLTELKELCSTNHNLKGKKVNFYFNDKKKEFIETLTGHVSLHQCHKGCCDFHFSSEDFSEIFAFHCNKNTFKDSFNLLVLDQFGVKYVTPEVLQAVSEFPMTDSLIFMSSFSIKRFHKLDNFIPEFQITEKDTKDPNFNHDFINYWVKDFFLKRMKSKYYLSTFSIQKGSNIYGILFGSTRLYGIEKFLEATWKIDTISGEANYNIQNDDWYGLTLFENQGGYKKENEFFDKLDEFLYQEKRVSNMQIREFALTNGFLTSKANEHLQNLKKEGRITTEPEGDARHGCFYLDHRASEKEGKVTYVIWKG